MNRAMLKAAKREHLVRMARWLGVARPEALEARVLVRELLRRLRRAGA